MSSEFRGLIRRMSRENALWGAPRIHGELRMTRLRGLRGGRVQEQDAAPSKAYLRRHGGRSSRTIVAVHGVDRLLRQKNRKRSVFYSCSLYCGTSVGGLFTVGTTPHPTAAWVEQQIRESFPWETAPRYMILRSGSCVRYCLSFADKGDGHRRGGDGAAIDVAVAVR